MLTLLLAAIQLPALSAEQSFPFVIPWDDALKGVATDASFLNAGPAGRNGPIVARDGHFYESKTGKRVRFFGTNLAAGSAFPDKADADKIAAHLAKLGVNLVRMHHMNNGWDLDGGTIWKRDRLYREIDPVQLDKLDYFVACLIKHGIYVNVNLQVSRNYLPEMGFPASVTQLKDYAKKVDKFNPKMIALQRQYARDLIGRKNPYLGRFYKDEPGVMVVEINNENSLVGWPGESPGAGLGALPEPFRGDLVRRWNDWLQRKYGNEAKLRKVWAGVATPLGRSLTSYTSKWSWENQSQGDVRFETVDGALNDAAPTIVATINSNPGPDWHVQNHLVGLNLTDGQYYTVKFRAKADRVTGMELTARLDKPDWRFLGLSASVSLGPVEKEYTYSFRAVGSEPNHARIGFVLGSTRGRVEISRLRVMPGRAADAWPEGASLAAKTIDLPNAGATPKFADYTDFLAETERAYSEGMRQFLVGELGFRHTNIIDSQISWGGLTSLERERHMQFADNHSYWNHPTFLKGDWSPTDYRVNRTALVDRLRDGQGTFGELAVFRVDGKPYSVSEYDHPSPNDFACEMIPLYATFAALQDWDAIYTFCYDKTGARFDDTRYAGYFDQNAMTAKSVFYPSAAILFRLGLVAPITNARNLPTPEKPWSRFFTPQEGWALSGGRPNALATRLSVGGSSTGSKATPGGATKVVDGAGGLVAVTDSARAKSIVGWVHGRSFATSGLAVRFGEFGVGFASLTWVPTDGGALATSKRSLLTVVARTENEGMAWNAARDSVRDQWGKGPVRAEIVPAEVTVAGRVTAVYALDPRGRRMEKMAVKNGRFAIGSATRSCYYEIVR